MWISVPDSDTVGVATGLCMYLRLFDRSLPIHQITLAIPCCLLVVVAKHVLRESNSPVVEKEMISVKINNKALSLSLPSLAVPVAHFLPQCLHL